MTVLGDKLQEKLEEKKSDINTFIWKFPRIKNEQAEMRLVDANYDQLRKFYKHCYEMLYNEDKRNPGRIKLLSIVDDQINRCRAELLIRWLRSEKQYTATACLEDLRKIINNNKEELTQETIKVYPIGYLMNGLPLEFNRVPVSLVMDACLDSLGNFNSSHITLNFIIKMGLWLTPQEMQDLLRKDENGKIIPRTEVIKKEFGLSPDTVLMVNSKTGLTREEFRQMHYLRKNKYSALTSDQLRLLSNKILYRFQNQCSTQAEQWKDKMAEIIKVAEHKGWDVTREIE